MLTSTGAAQNRRGGFEAIGFYNLDKFFDTIKDPYKNDRDYLPYGALRWTGTDYRHKLERMAFSIWEMAAKEAPHGLTALGVCEVENRHVLEDLVMTPPLNERQWGIVHYESPDIQGLDVAFLYQRNRFELIGSQRIALQLVNKPNFRTRDQLLVTGRIAGEIVHFIVVHYPARGNCQECTHSQRTAAARLTLAIVRTIQKKSADAKIIIMGDFNDNPVNYTITAAIGAKKNIAQVRKGEFFNAFYPLYKDGARSTVYRGRWQLFDQMIVSHSLLQGSDSNKGLRLYQATLFNTPVLVDNYTNGMPSRTNTRGFSTHFPIYLTLINEKTNTPPIIPQRKNKKRTTIKTKEWHKDSIRIEYIFGEEREVFFTD
jgi:hypothetical protein